MNPVHITESEWYVLACLWERSPQNARELTESLKKTTGWSRSTTLTMLRRMSDKGLIRCSSEDGGIRTYTTDLAENEVRMRETEHFLARVYKGSVSMMLSAITDGKKLDDTEIDALYEILRQAEEKK